MQTPDTKACTSMLLLALLALSGCSGVKDYMTRPRNLAVSVDHRRGDPEIQVRVRDVASTATFRADDWAGDLAVRRACSVLLGEGKGFLGIRSFTQEAYGVAVETAASRTVYHGGTDGRPVGVTYTPAQYGTSLLGRADLHATALTTPQALDPDGVRNQMQILHTRSCKVLEFKAYPHQGDVVHFVSLDRDEFSALATGATERDAGLVAMGFVCDVARQLTAPLPYLVVNHFSLGARDGRGRALVTVQTADTRRKAMFERLKNVVDVQTCEVINPDVRPLGAD